MITCIIIDDEENARITFNKLIQRYLSGKLRVVNMAKSVKEGAEAIHKHHPDIVFLDVEMPEENGFALFDYFKEYNFEVIFTTAHKQYAVDAIKYAALDYLLKPINFMDIKESLVKFRNKQNKRSRQQRIETLLSNVNIGESWKQKIALPTFDGYQMEAINDIVYCQADINYTQIFLKNSSKIIVSKTLKYIENLLPDDLFFRIHKTYLVNINYIKKYSKIDGPRITLENGTQLEVATRRTEEFVKAITKK